MFLSFIGPGYLYLLAEKLGDPKDSNLRKFDRYVAWGMIGFGMTVLLMVFIANIYDFF